MSMDQHFLVSFAIDYTLREKCLTIPYALYLLGMTVKLKPLTERPNLKPVGKALFI